MDLEELKGRFEGLLRDQPSMTRYRALADTLRGMIESGHLPHGERLPTHRDLAAALEITLGTVGKAYADLSRRSLTTATVGRGTFVVHRGEDTEVYTRPPLAPRGGNGGRVEGFSREQPLDMGFVNPFEHLNPPLVGAVGRLAALPHLNELSGYQPPRGRRAHREAGARWAGRFGVPAAADNVLVCAGAQHALLTVLSSLFCPGDRIAVEQLSYPLLKLICRRLNLQTVSVRMDENGMLPDALETACRARPVRGVYLMPSCHNPTLTMMPEFRRRELVDVCRRHDAAIIEDDVCALSMDQRAAPFSCIAPERSIFIASTSEALGAGLRTAYICSPERWVERLAHTIGCTISMAPPLMAELAAMWIDDGTADYIIAAKREAAVRANTLAREAFDGFSLETRTTGWFCWLRLPESPGSAARFAARAREAGIIVAESDYFTMGGAVAEEGVRLALGIRDQDLLNRALQTLASLLNKG